MLPKNKPTIISLGGSLIIPSEINSSFLLGFRRLLLSEVRGGKRFVVVCGGGSVTRHYQHAAKAFYPNISNEERDQLGITCTVLNARLVRALFHSVAHRDILINPKYAPCLSEKHPVIIGAGWKPGCSTDYDAVLAAEAYGSHTVVNLSNVACVYDKDPLTHPDAQAYSSLSWKAFRKLIPRDWRPGSHVPFDPKAAQRAQKHGMTVYVLDGTALPNVRRALNGKSFQGTVIHS